MENVSIDDLKILVDKHAGHDIIAKYKTGDKCPIEYAEVLGLRTEHGPEGLEATLRSTPWQSNTQNRRSCLPIFLALRVEQMDVMLELEKLWDERAMARIELVDGSVILGVPASR